MIDTYTKIILTIIAVVLVMLLLRPALIPNSVTASGLSNVNIAEVGGYIVRGGKIMVEVK